MTMTTRKLIELFPRRKPLRWELTCLLPFGREKGWTKVFTVLSCSPSSKQMRMHCGCSSKFQRKDMKTCSAQLPPSNFGRFLQAEQPQKLLWATLQRQAKKLKSAKAVHPRKLFNMEAQNGGGWKMMFLFKQVIFRFHAGFRWCSLENAGLAVKLSYLERPPQLPARPP